METSATYELQIVSSKPVERFNLIYFLFTYSIMYSYFIVHQKNRSIKILSLLIIFHTSYNYLTVTVVLEPKIRRRVMSNNRIVCFW